MTKQLISTTDHAPVPALNELQRDLKKFEALLYDKKQLASWVDLCRLYQSMGIKLQPAPDLAGSDETRLAEWRKAAEMLPALRARWAEVDRPASANFIAAEIAKLATVFPNSIGPDPDMFLQVMADDVQDDQPTYYALATAAHAYRRKHKFLSISDLVAELKRAEKKAGRLRYLFDEFELPKQLDDIERDLPLRLRQREEREPEKYIADPDADDIR